MTFGSGQHGQLGHQTAGVEAATDFLKPKLVDALQNQNIVQISAGSTATCAVTDNGQLYLWGFGESFHPRKMSNVIDKPRLVKLHKRIKQVACGQSHILVLTVDGDVYSFGNGGMGQLGHGATT